MDKNAIKKYAVWARRELISRVSQRAALYEITDKGYGDASADSVLGRVMSAEEKRQRQALIAQIREKGYEQVMEEIAYTWFNRFIALRFMEVNGYLPSRVRVFTDDENNFKPQILTEAINMELDGMDLEKVYALKNANDDDALFKYMLIVQCNALSSILPGMFQHISDYTELLFPDNLLREGSVIEQMIVMIPEKDWTDQVQIIGWLYQYYNTEEFNAIYDGELSATKIGKELIPAATQMFTPDWVVRYMVENSLGRLWQDGHPNESLVGAWKYYIRDNNAFVPDKANVYANIKPEEIKVLDPCQGSGHILVYMFDVLVQIYEDYGYSAREAVGCIIEKNLWGIDIDNRASQLAYFSVMMKARQYDRRFFTRKLQPHVYAVTESNTVDRNCITYFSNGRSDIHKAITTVVDALIDAKEYGSILRIQAVDFDALFDRFSEIENEQAPSLYTIQTIESLLPLVKLAFALSQKYDIVITNPPYLGSGKFSAKLANYIEKNYPDEKSDLGMVMLKRILFSFVKPYGYAAAITTVSWMFIKSFEKFRVNVISNKQFVNLVDFGTELFDGKIGHLPVAAWVNRNTAPCGVIQAVRLVDFCYSRRDEKETEFFNSDNRYAIEQKELEQIPGMPLAYWINEDVIGALSKRNMGSISEARMGLTTGRNEKYLRLWFEVEFQSIGLGFDRWQAKRSGLRWFPYDKGGDYRKWYGNRSYVVDWKDDGHEMQTTLHPDGKRIWAHNFNLEYNYRPHISWNDVVMNALSFRYFEQGFLFDSAAATTFVPQDKEFAILAYLNSDFVNELAKLLNPTVHFKLGDYSKLPYGDWDFALLDELARQNVQIAKDDWDSFETSWGFMRHPLVMGTGLISDSYEAWKSHCQERYGLMARNEAKIDEYFEHYYHTSTSSKQRVVSVSTANIQRDVKSLISFAVGCMFGRYSLDEEGVVYAGGEWLPERYKTILPDANGIIPISDDEYFQDDIVNRFVLFVEKAYGREHLEENLKYVAEALGGNGSSREIIRNYFLNDFYKDHCTTYQVTGSGKRPIYWLFDSGKKNGFKCLIYMHRYQPDTIARIRTDYVHEQQSRYRTAIADLESRIANAGTGERVKLSKQLNKLQEQAEELRVYEEKIHHLADQMIRIDLDDGVKHNYAIFQDVLAKIK